MLKSSLNCELCWYMIKIIKKRFLLHRIKSHDQINITVNFLTWLFISYLYAYNINNLNSVTGSGCMNLVSLVSLIKKMI